MKLRNVLFGIFGLISLFTIFTGFLVVRVEEIVSQLEQTANIRYQSYQAADELRQSSDDLTRLARTYVVTGDSRYEQMYQAVLDIRNGERPRPENYHLIYWDLVLEQGEKPKADGELQALKSRMQQLGFSDREFALLTQAQNNSDALVNMEVKAMNAVKGRFQDPATGAYSVQGQPDLQLARDLMHNSAYHREKARIMEPVDEFFQSLEQRTAAAQQQRLEQVMESVTFALIMAVSSLVLIILGFLMIKRYVALPMARLYQQVIQLKAGKAEQADTDTFRLGQFEELQESAQETLSSISSALVQVSEAADICASGAVEIASGNTDLSQRTESQASSIVEISASISQMRRSTESSATEANKANESAKEAKVQAVEGGEIVTAAIKAMDDIAVSSKKITNILTVIDEITFQTNLLALNASVEAARAGEQGRGFGVVAGEVRSLAQRSSVAAKNINELIQDSMDKVHAGTLHVNKAGEALINIKAQVSEVTEVIETLNTNTREQASGIAQIEQAIMDFEDSNQQNAAMVQQVSTASANVAEMAGQVVEMITGFHVAEQKRTQERRSGEDRRKLTKGDSGIWDEF
ncbi:methyl-accepting chemotaxis protein [Shewanella corallii]|uniref:Methyl-accepting chemotaxis protein n=1 Tax=Shewanella corallii TaxID=560080 RepID=A0ABT0NDH1_9GAMM|nr:methyl-accepting chemotaxis protein [Shewanella corallii]MCL2916523.1 methyl-accepting chemotaxis protein [Shewanella corallii]